MSVDKSLVQIAVSLCDAAGSVFSKDLKEKILRSDLGSILTCEVDPSQYTTADAYFRDAACAAFLKKCPLPDSPFDRRKAAIENFWAGEKSCTLTNLRFKNLLEHCYADEDLVFIEFLDKARDFCSRVLGPMPKRLEPRFGPGATYGDRGRLTTIPDKITADPTITSGALCMTQFIWETAWGRSMMKRGRSFQVVRGNRFTTVPKDGKKDRGICVEPSANIALQLSVGGHIRERIRYFGSDLKNLQPIHREWARMASRTGDFATIDLSNASDSIAFNLVKFLLPPDWFTLLSSLRSPLTLIEGKWVRNEKFSSMGNGFTFELETLIFSSLCHSFGVSMGSEFSVFGDDIIFPTEKAYGLLRLLSYCGFLTNARKTFVTGRFRESCGGDFFDGVGVRPYSLKVVPSSPAEWMAVANGLYRNCLLDSPIPDLSWCFGAWKRALDNIPSAIRRLRGPSSLGDLVICSSSYPVVIKNGIRYVRAYQPVPNILPWSHWSGDVQMASILYGSGSSQGVIPRGGVFGHKVSLVPYS